MKKNISLKTFTNKIILEIKYQIELLKINTTHFLTPFLLALISITEVI